jgi:hypothetical protein
MSAAFADEAGATGAGGGGQEGRAMGELGDVDPLDLRPTFSSRARKRPLGSALAGDHGDGCDANRGAPWASSGAKPKLREGFLVSHFI